MKGLFSCFASVAISGLTVAAFAPASRSVTPARTASSSVPMSSSFPRTRLFMAESSIQENNFIEQPPEELQIPLVEDELVVRWDEGSVDRIVNTGILYGVAALVLAKVVLIDQDVSRGWTAAEVLNHMPTGLWDSYMGVLTDSPISTKAVTSASVYTIGDVIAQQTEGASIGEIDRMRVLRSMLAGLLAHGPLSHYWYGISEGLFNHVLHWTAWWSFLPKVIVDQAFWGPAWNNIYILLLGLMKGESLTAIWDDVKKTTIPLVVSGLKLWPLAHCVTYGLVPVENRLLWVDLVEIVWVMILSSSAAKAAGAHHGPPTVDATIDVNEELASVHADDTAYVTQ